MEQYLIQYTAQHIAVAGGGGGDFHGLADGTAETAGGVGVLGKDLAAHIGGHAGAGSDRCAVGAHDLAAEGFLLIAHLDHVDLAVQPEVAAGHGEGGTPLARARFGGHALEALFLGVVSLRDGAVQLVAAAGVVAFEFIVDLRRGAEGLFQSVGAAQRTRTVHPVVFPDLVRDGDVGRGVVQFLLYQLIAENAVQLLGRHGLEGAGVQQGSGLVFHIGPHIVPCGGQLRFFQIKLVRDVRFGLHKACPFRAGCTCRPLLAGQEGKIKTAPVPKHIA